MQERCPRSTAVEFENEYCKFKPLYWQEVDGVLRPILLKVVTSEYKSLGLRRHPEVRDPNILEYMVGEWVKMRDEDLLATKQDWGGIWSLLKPSDARTIMKYMLEQYKISTQTRVFITALDLPIFANSYRVKSRGVILLEETSL